MRGSYKARHRATRPLEDRFWEKVQKAEGDACWLWVGAIQRNGYGKLEQSYAHRVAYELTHGPIPKGEGFHGTCVLHSCDNRRCVNPAHLRLGTHADNMRDRVAHGRWRNGSDKGRRLAPEQVAEIRSRRATGETIESIATDFGVTASLVTMIAKGKVWRRLLGKPPRKAQQLALLPTETTP